MKYGIDFFNTRENLLTRKENFMVHTFALYVTEKIVNTFPSEISNYDMYIYAFEKMFSQISFYIILIIVAFINHTTIDMIVYISFLTLLRGQTNGYHSNTPLGCFILSFLVSNACIWCSKLIFNYLPWIVFPFLIFASIYIFVTAPVNHILLNWTLHELEMHKISSRRILICELFLIVIFYFFHFTRTLCVTSSFAIITVAIFMVLSKILKQEVKYYD